jgi:hypothetical protein
MDPDAGYDGYEATIAHQWRSGQDKALSSIIAVTADVMKAPSCEWQK